MSNPHKATMRLVEEDEVVVYREDLAALLAKLVYEHPEAAHWHAYEVMRFALNDGTECEGT